MDDTADIARRCNDPYLLFIPVDYFELNRALHYSGRKGLAACLAVRLNVSSMSRFI
jgi:hypothetical protein